MFADPFWLQKKITTDPHIFSHINILCPDDRNPELNIFVSELTLGSYRYMPIAYITMH